MVTPPQKKRRRKKEYLTIEQIGTRTYMARIKKLLHVTETF